MDLKTEERLIKTAQKGGRAGREAFGKIYQHYKPHLEKFFSARLGKNPKLEDLVSEVFKKALAGIDSFRWQGISLSAWLYKISRNVLIDFFRENGRKTEIDIETISPPPSLEPGPEQWYLKDAQENLLHELLEELPEREREIIYLKFFEGRTNKSIAAEMNLSETNVGTIVYRTIRKLRAKILQDRTSSNHPTRTALKGYN